MAKLSNLIKAMSGPRTTEVSDAWADAVDSGCWNQYTHDDGLYHPSSIAQCPVLMFLRMEGFPIPEDGPGFNDAEKLRINRSLYKGVRIFGNGDGVHERLQRDLCDIGLLDVSALDDTQETPISIPQYKIGGHCDGVLNFGKRSLQKERNAAKPFLMFGKPVRLWKHLDNSNRAALEIKSINERGYKEVMEKGPKEDHKYQANIYCKALDLPRTIFIYENKNTQEWLEKSVNFDQAMWTDVVNRITTVEQWRKEYRKTGQIPKECLAVAAASAKDRKPWGIYAIDLLRPRLGERSLVERHQERMRNTNKLLRRRV